MVLKYKVTQTFLELLTSELLFLFLGLELPS